VCPSFLGSQPPRKSFLSAKTIKTRNCSREEEMGGVRRSGMGGVRSWELGGVRSLLELDKIFGSEVGISASFSN